MNPVASGAVAMISFTLEFFPVLSPLDVHDSCYQRKKKLLLPSISMDRGSRTLPDPHLCMYVFSRGQRS
jgi:hypothetical protein